jgi:DNA-binding response OmpR family regulator
MATIMVVEDDVDMSNLIRSHLEQEGHTVYQAFDGLSVLPLIAAHSPDLAILDLMLPSIDGLVVCRQIRQQYLMPIIMLTARGEEVDRVLGLEVGADDYLVKPFSIRELLARVRSILRRVVLDTTVSIPETQAQRTTLDTQSANSSTQDVLVHGPLHVNIAARRVTLYGNRIDLTRREFDLLLLLASHPDRAFSRKFLLDRVWGADYTGTDRTVDSHIVQVRRKLGAYGEKITTVWGIGYRFTD